MNWKRKLSSRKFWLAIIGFVTAVLIAIGADSLTIEQVAGVITAGGVLIAYILGESYVDGRKDGNDVEPEHTDVIGFDIDDDEK